MTKMMNLKVSALVLAMLTLGLSACNDSNDDVVVQPPVVEEKTPDNIELVRIGAYESGIFGASAAEIPAFDAGSKRVFVVNAEAGELDVLDVSDPAHPKKISAISTHTVLPNSEVNSVAVQHGIVAVAVQAANKTDLGKVAFYKASDLSFISAVSVGALPDMLTFSPDGKLVVVANEGEPSDDYQTDPEGSIAIIDISDIQAPKAVIAGFTEWNATDKKAALIQSGVRIYGPNATVAQDLEPEYVTISTDSKKAWVTLQENNAIAEVDLSTKKVTQIYALGEKDHGLPENALDLSDTDGKINIQPWPGVVGLYQPDALANYQFEGQTYLVTANEGDARAWGETNPLYWGKTLKQDANAVGDSSKGYVEEFRVKHLVHKDGFSRRQGDDLPPQLRALAKGANLNPAIFSYCGAVLGDAQACRNDEQLGRLNIVWNMGYQKNVDGLPKLDSKGYMTYDKLYAMGGRSFAIWDTQGKLVWDSGRAFEAKVAELFPAHFNTNHEKSLFDDRSDNKGPEPEGLALGQIGKKTFAFIGLERMGGIMVYDISNPKKAQFVQYLNDRNFKQDTVQLDKNGQKVVDADGKNVLIEKGDLGPEGLVFIAANQSPNGKPLLVVGNEVSGSTAVYEIKLK